MTSKRPYRGVFPVAPTIFDADGNLDLDGQRRCIDFMIDAGSQGICILANFSEQFVLTDAERETVMHTVLKHVSGRIPVIVTTTHFSSAICAARSRQAEEAGAAMVMVMPPYHGATFRVPEGGIFEFFRVVSDAVNIPVMIQDAPVAGTPLSVDFLARMAKELANIRYFKVEVAGAAAELAQGQQGVVADHAARAGPQRGQLGDQLCRAMPGEPGPDVVRAGQDQGPGLVDRLGSLGAGGALGDHQRPDCLHRAVTSSWRSGRPAGLGGAGGTDRIERIGLALAAPVLPVRAVHFHDPDPGRSDVPGQARAIAASPLDPDQAHRAEAVQPAQ